MKFQRVSLLVLAIGAGCGSNDGGGTYDDSTATLSIEPAMTELVIRNGVPATASFTATATYPDGETRDVTAEVLFTIDTSLGAFTGAQLTMTAVGKTSVFGSWSEKTAAASVLARLENIRVDPSLPPNAGDWFATPEDAARAPTVVYPPADVVMPRNLGDFEVHWTDAQNDVFEITLNTDFSSVRVIVPGTPGQLANGRWMQFLASEWLAAVGNEATVSYQVRGVSSQSPTSVGSAPRRTVKLSNESMLGGLYYWAATAANNAPYGIFRHDMSKPGEPAEQFFTTAQTNGRCVACHVLSRDGTRMAITYDGGNQPATMVDVATRQPQTESRAWNFGTFTPDGSKFLAVHAGTLTVLDYATQAPLATMTSAALVSHPDLSPDGTRLVYVTRSAGLDWTFTGGQLVTRTFDSATNTFGPEQPLVTGGDNNYYPSFSPDGQWVLFNKGAGGNAYNNANASLWVVKADGSGSPVELAAANAALDLTNSWGRWAPFAQTFGVGTDPMYWVTVSSTRDFGVRLVGARRPQLWMTPFFPGRALSQQDPSGASFRLPFQDLLSNNHIAQWTEQVVAPL